MAYISVDSLLGMEEKIVWVDANFAVENQPHWIAVLFLILSLLMLIEIIAENVHLHKTKETIPELEDEIVRLKAKLYDQAELGDEDDEDDDEDDEDEDED